MTHSSDRRTSVLIRCAALALCMAATGCHPRDASTARNDPAPPPHTTAGPATPAPPRAAPPKAPPVQERVDCDRMCVRTFKTCVRVVMVGTGKLTAQQWDLVQKAGKVPRMQQIGYDACMKDCNKKQGAGSDAGDINRCLALPDCDKYAACIQQFIK